MGVDDPGRPVKRAILSLAAGVVLWGCSVDFVAVSDRTEVYLRLETVHDVTGVSAAVLGIVHGPLPARLIVDGREVEVSEAVSERYTYEADLVVDSLDPGILAEVSLAGGDSIVLAIPAVARSGDPAWTPTGDLMIPIRFGDGHHALRGVSWSATVLHAGRGPIAVLDHRMLESPDRILVPDSLLPERAAFLVVECRGSLAGRAEPFTAGAGFRSTLEIALPVQGPASDRAAAR